MAQISFPAIYSTGPVHHYARVKTDPSRIWYLGTAEVTPQIQFFEHRQAVFNDIAGKTLPIQFTRDGESASVSVLLTRYSELTYDVILRSTAYVPTSAGGESRFSRGGLVFGREDFEVWQFFERALDPSVAGTVEDPGIGYYWPRVLLHEHQFVALGTQARKLLLVFDCHPAPIFTVESGGTRLDGWRLYDTDPALFPNDVRVPQ